MRLSASLLSLVVLLSPALSRAQPAPPPAQPAPPPAQPAPPPAQQPAPTGQPATPPTLPRLEPQVWQEQYSQARQLVVEGRFAEAVPTLERLVMQTEDPRQRAMAAELAWLTRVWSQQRLVLRPGGAPEAARGEEGGKKFRTLDELSVLYTSAVLYGLGTGGWFAVQTEPRSPSGFIMPALLLAGGSAGAVALLDRGEGMRYGVPQSIVSGLYLGLQEGIVLATWNQARVVRAEEWSEKTVASVIWGFSTVGAVAGGVLGAVGGATPGRASFVGSAGLWGGLLSGLVTAAVVTDDSKADDKALLAGALGLNVGAGLGAYFAKEVSPSIARVRFLDLGGISGGLLFGGLYLSASGRDSTPQAALGVTTLGIATGLGVSWYATRNMSPDRPQAEASHRPRLVEGVRVGLQPTPGGLSISVGGALL